jgi:PAS domain S-box-containing protein
MPSKRRSSQPFIFQAFENSMKVFAEICPTGIYLADIYGKYVYVNPAWCKMAGLTMSEAEGDGWMDAVHPLDRDRIHQERNNQVDCTIPRQSEYRFIDSKENITWVHSTATLFEKSGSQSCIIGFIFDITHRKEHETGISESEEKHRLFMENSGLGIGYYDTEGKIINFNHEAIRNMGGKPSDYIGKNLTDVFGKEKGDFFIERLKLTAESEIPLKYEDLVLLGGRPGWYLSTHSRIYNKDNQIEGIQVISDNITELKDTEKKLKESQKKLKVLTQHLENIREEERSKIALNLHDDLGQNLTALNLDIAWLKGRIGVQSQEVRKKFSEMHSLISETMDSIREISSFLRPSILYELGLIQAMDWQLKKLEKQSGIKCHFIYKSQKIKIENHIALILYRILQETLTNIIRHAKASEAEIRLESTKNIIELSIKDNGKGIEPEKVNSFKSLGLTGIKERVKSIGGTVVILSEIGSGTSIQVSIPKKIRKKQ